MFTQDELNAVNDLIVEATAFMDSGDLQISSTGRRFYIVGTSLQRIMQAIVAQTGLAQPVADDTDPVKADASALEAEASVSVSTSLSTVASVSTSIAEISSSLSTAASLAQVSSSLSVTEISSSLSASTSSATSASGSTSLPPNFIAPSVSNAQ